MTDSEMTERVAREVMGMDAKVNSSGKTEYIKGLWGDMPVYREFSPIADANDLQMVKDKLREMGYEPLISIRVNGRTEIYLWKDNELTDISVEADTEAHAILEAAIKAVERETGNNQ